jgi:hypothetical protein
MFAYIRFEPNIPAHPNANTLNLSFLNLDHVIYKQLQINVKYTFRLVFLLHVLILKVNKQLYPRC